MAEKPLQRCHLFWYSGTGNSYLVAEKIAETLAKNSVPTTLIQIKSGLVADVPPEALIGFVFPIAAGGTYPFIWEFFENLPSGKNLVFMVDTLGAFSGGIKGPLAKCLVKKGYKPLLAAEIIMPENFPPGRKFLPEENQKRVTAGLDRIESLVGQILQGDCQWRDIPYFSTFMGLICRFKAPWSTMRRIFSFKIDRDRCSKCGLCLKLCPISNIVADAEGFALMKNGCQTCMRCVAYCPEGAILSKRGSRMDYKAVSVEKLLCDRKEF